MPSLDFKRPESAGALVLGANVNASDIEMTAPVLTEPERPEAGQIVGAPEVNEEKGVPTTLTRPAIGGWSVGFVFPADQTVETALMPTGYRYWLQRRRRALCRWHPVQRDAGKRRG